MTLTQVDECRWLTRVLLFGLVGLLVRYLVALLGSAALIRLLILFLASRRLLIVLLYSKLV